MAGGLVSLLRRSKHFFELFSGCSAVPIRCYDEVQLSGLTLHQDGPLLKLYVALPTFPDHPSIKWHKDCNKVKLAISFWGIENLSISGWDTTNIVRMRMANSNHNRYTLEAHNIRFTMSAAYLVARIDSVTAYQVESAQ
jgi:hypothetical protein